MAWLRPPARFWTGVLGLTALALTLAVGIRLLAPRTPWAPAPAVVAADPPDGAVDVLPRTAITLRFSAPMNRAAAADALSVDPPAAGSLLWSDDATQLTFRPTESLTPGVTYTVRLDAGALGRWWRPIEAPATVRFRTAQQPAVVTALPAAAGAPVDTSLAVIFSQPMVPPEAIGRGVAPPIRLSPPADIAASWADERTLLLRPTGPLAPATRYTATVGPGLVDLRGIALGAPFSWSFTTAWPAILKRSPEDGARWVSPRAPLTLALDAPLDTALLRQALRITPPLDGEITSAVVGATQVITFTPTDSWAFGTAYSVELAEPAGSDLGPPPPSSWGFEVEPRPRLLAFFPGQGQLLAPGQPIRLVFSTPMELAALSAGLSIEPPVAAAPIRVDETEVRLTPELRPSTLYTITVAAGTADRSGEPLGADVQVRLRTAPARPALAVPKAFAGIVTLPVSRTAAIGLEATNLSALELSLYRLDQPTLLLALELSPEERRQFNPERYGQPLARGWRLDRSDPLDQPAALTLPVGLADGDPLDPGAYFLRAVSPEGPGVDLLLLVSASRLTMRQGPDSALVWATDSATGAPLPSLPIALYRDGAPLASGVTGPDGTWALPVSRDAGGPLLAIAEAGGPALVRGDWIAPRQAPPIYAAEIFADRAAYPPGATVRLTGLARRTTPEGGLTTPAPDAACRLQLRGAAALSLTPGSACSIDPASGILRGEIALPARLAPGFYNVAVQLGDLSLAVPVQVEAPRDARRTLELVVRPTADALTVAVAAEGLPLAGSVVSWSLRLEPLAAPAPPDGFTLGPLPALAPRELSGRAATDDAGSFTVGPLDAALSPLAQRYLLRVDTLDEQPGSADLQGLIQPAQTIAAARLPSRIIPSDQRTTVELAALDGLGRPAPGARISLQVFRGEAAGAPLLARVASAGDDGRATTQLVQLNPGVYELVAAADGGPPTRERLWVYGGRFVGWPSAEGRVEVVADRDRYSPGDVATLLVTSPAPQASLLLTVERGGLIESQVRSLRGGQVITLPISADMAPGVSVGALVAVGETIRAGSAALAVAGGPPPLGVAVAADSAGYLPGSTATLTITTGAAAAPLAADLLVTIAPDLGELDLGPQPAPLLAAPPAPFAVAALPPPAPSPEAPPMPPRPATPGTILPLEAGAGAPGTVVGRVALPADSGRWRVTAYAASGPDRVSAASTVISTTRPLAYSLVAPPTLRYGDQAGFDLAIRNTSITTREVRVALAASGLALDPPAPADQVVALAPGAAIALSWQAAPAAGAEQATVRLTITSEGLSQTIRRELPVIVEPPPVERGATFVASGPLGTSLEIPAAAPEVRVAVAPGLRAALADQANALAALDDPATDDMAALGLIAAGLARSAAPEERPGWEALAREAIDALAAAQNPDGGWGWWPGSKSESFVTAFAVEAQAAAGAAIDDAGPPSLRAIAYLSRQAPSADPDTRAYIAYVLSRSGGGAGAIPVALSPTAVAAETLAADGLAFVALALPPAQAAPALDRLDALVSPAGGWEAAGPAWLPRSPTAVTAAAAQALGARRPNAPALPGAVEALLAAWGVDGWQTSYEAARVAAALLGRPATVGLGPGQVLLAGTPILGDGEPITRTLRASVPATGLGASPALSVQAAASASYLVAYSAGAAPPAVAGRLALAQELVDPVSGAALDPAAIRLGQLVALRVTAVIPAALLRADLEVALPAGLEPLPASFAAPFAHSGGPETRRSVTFGAAQIAPGVYTQTLLARAVARGDYTAPPTRLTATFDPTLVALAPAAIAVTITE